MRAGHFIIKTRLQAGRRLGQHVRSGADRSHLIEEGIVEGSFSTNSSTIMLPLKCENIEDQNTRASVRGHKHRNQLRSKLKLVNAKQSALSLSAGGGIGIQWVMFLTGCPEKKSIQCG